MINSWKNISQQSQSDVVAFAAINWVITQYLSPLGRTVE